MSRLRLPFCFSLKPLINVHFHIGKYRVPPVSDETVIAAILTYDYNNNLIRYPNATNNTPVPLVRSHVFGSVHFIIIVQRGAQIAATICVLFFGFVRPVHGKTWT